MKTIVLIMYGTIFIWTIEGKVQSAAVVVLLYRIYYDFWVFLYFHYSPKKTDKHPNLFFSTNAKRRSSIAAKVESVASINNYYKKINNNTFNQAHPNVNSWGKALNLSHGAFTLNIWRLSCIIFGKLSPKSVKWRTVEPRLKAMVWKLLDKLLLTTELGALAQSYHFYHSWLQVSCLAQNFCTKMQGQKKRS